MERPFTITFSSDVRADAIRIHRSQELPRALRSIGLHHPCRTLVLIGGASGLKDVELARVRPLFVDVLAPLVEDLKASVVDGGTDFGVMRLMGWARAQTRARFPLIGVSAARMISLPGTIPSRLDAAPLEPHHSHFVLVPGSNWGDDSPWLSRVATILSGTNPSVTLLVNGGEIARKDMSQSVKNGRPVVVVGGTGRLADEIAAAGDQLPLLSVVDLRDGMEKVAAVVSSLLKGDQDEQV